MNVIGTLLDMTDCSITHSMFIHSSSVKSLQYKLLIGLYFGKPIQLNSLESIAGRYTKKMNHKDGWD